jgi:thiamine-phosphate pyrophosphorylase
MTDGKRGTAGRPLVQVIREATRGGVGMVVIRERDLADAELGALLEELLPLRRKGVRLLISRRLDIARAYGLDGVHLASDAIPVREARSWLGPRAWIGYSAHSPEEARRVATEGSSYVTLSPIYPTGSKAGADPRGVDWLSTATRDLPIPALALGGVTPERVGEVLRAGAWGVAVVSAVGGAPNVEEAARRMARAVEEVGH